MKKYGKKYAPWLLFLFVAACLLTSTAAALPDSGAAASVPQAELEQALEEAIFRRRDGTPADVSQYNLTEEQLAPVTAGVLADNYADALVTVSYDSAGANSVSAMDVEMDSTLSMALDELDQINENSPEPMSGPELQTVYAHYAELQAYYESEPEYFGLPCPYFTSKDTETSPIGAILAVAGIPQAAIDAGDSRTIQQVDQIILGFTDALRGYVAEYGDTLLAARDRALSHLDSNMTAAEKLLVLNDWLAGSCTFDMSAVTTGEEPTDMIGSTAFGALVKQNCACLGYSAAYVYLVQCAFPEIYQNGDGSWKTKEEVNGGENPAYLIDFVKIIWDADVSILGEESHFGEPHFFNAVKLDGKWYYADPCYSDISVQCIGRNRVETDGNLSHLYFLCSDPTMREWYRGNFEAIDTLYQELAVHDEYEDAWFTDAAGPVSYDDDYWYYVKNQSTLEQVSPTEAHYNQVPDQLVARPRSLTDPLSTAGETVLLDYATGQGATTGGAAVTSELVQNEYLLFQAYAEKYPSLAHSLALYRNALYFNTSNKILKYDLHSGAVSLVKEYNRVSAVRDTSNPFPGQSFSVVPEGSADIAHTVFNPPLAALCLKDDGKLYVQVATNFCHISDYAVEEVNYNPACINYGNYQSRCDNDNEEFMWSANFVETLDMSHMTGSQHIFQSVTVAPFCGQQGYTENRCTTCGISDGGPRTALTDAQSHHFVPWHDVFYTRDSAGVQKSADIYVCVHCMETRNQLEEGETAGHVYGQPTFQWADDYTKCEAVFTCAVCDGTQTAECACRPEDTRQTVACTVRKDVTGNCTAGGRIVYTAACQRNGQTYREEQSVTILPGTAHTFVNGTCSRCGERDAFIHQTVSLRSASSDMTGVTICWDALDGADSYRVYRKIATGWKRLETVQGTSYTDTGTRSGSSYTYTVRGRKADGTLSRYDKSGLTTKYLSKVTLSTPTNVSSGITVKWSKVTGASGYKVYRQAGSSTKWSTVATIKSGSTVSWTDTKTSSGTKYTYSVRAYSGKYMSVKGSTNGLTKTMYRLSRPSITYLKNTGSRKFTVKWKKVSGATGYQVSYRIGSAASKRVTVKGSSTVSKSITGLSKGKTYKVYVRAYKTVGGKNYYSAWSGAKSVIISK